MKEAKNRSHPHMTWKPSQDELYYFITINDRKGISYRPNIGTFQDEDQLRIGNCFQTVQEAEAKLVEILEVLKK